VLDLAARWAAPGSTLTLDAVHRFTDPDYADLTLLMRTGERSGEVFDQLLARGEIVIHASEVERLHALAADAVSGTDAAGDRHLVVADTREQVAQLNDAIRDRRVATGLVDDRHAFTTDAGARIGIGDRVATRRNDRDLQVANRDTWTVTGIDDGAIALTGRTGTRTLPAGYAREHLELAYATTVYGAQGDTVATADLLVGDQTGAAAAYVAMTRGRHRNTAHLVAESVDDARAHWVTVFARDRADLGPAHAAEVAAEDLDRYGTQPSRDRGAALQAAALKALHTPEPSRHPQPYPSGHQPGPGIGR
jgi:hypothetical protein